MKITVASVAGRARNARFDGLATEYLDRLQPYAKVDAHVFKSSEALFEWTGKLKSRTSLVLVLLDERGRQLSSQAFAEWLGCQRDEGQQRIIFSIGPADGWSGAERAHAGILLSLGPMTLPHELVRVVISEQLYRAFTILAGHPYHRGG